MKLLIADPSYADFEGDASVLPRIVSDALSEIGEVELDRADIGPGADWPMFLAILSGVGTVLLLGEKVDTSLTGWISVGGKLKRGLEILREKLGATRIDETGAQLLLIEQLAREGTLTSSIELLFSQTIPIHELSGRPEGELESRHDALYVLGLRVDDERIVVAGVRSSGEVDFVHTYGAHFMTFGMSRT
jgi:hypothetical protein